MSKIFNPGKTDFSYRCLENIETTTRIPRHREYLYRGLDGDFHPWYKELKSVGCTWLTFKKVWK